MDGRKLLSLAPMYRLCSWSVGAEHMRRQYSQQYIRAQRGQRVLDLGCGPGDMLAFLPDVDYEGYDISEAYIKAARDKFGDRGRFSAVRVDELREREWPEPFDLVLATAVLHHLDDGEAAVLFDIARRALRPSGRLVTLDGCYRAGQSAIARMLLNLDRGQYVRTEQAYARLASAAFGSVRTSLREDLAAVPYTYIIMECAAPLSPPPRG
jgi:SAM-dependent methyltransferase